MRRVDPWLVVGLALVGALVAIAAYGERFAPYEPIYSVIRGPDGERPPFPPGGLFPLGSDNAGRDLLSLVLHGARATLAIVCLAGLIRLVAGAAAATLAIHSASIRVVVDASAEVVSAIPTTLLALIVVLAFFGPDTPALAFVGALAVAGWAGPYRVLRAELARLRCATFTEGARALGARSRDILLRHHLPHLVPVLALSASQQVAWSFVALAELGVLGAFVGAVRPLDGLRVPQIPEWGGMLATGRTVQNLYLTRWVFLVPAAALALAAVAIALAGTALARQYARRNFFSELRPRRGLVGALAISLALVPAAMLPERYEAARQAAREARALAALPPVDDTASVERAFREAGLHPIGGQYAVERRATQVLQTGRARLTLQTPAGEVELREGWDRESDFAPVLYRATGGGRHELPVVFAGWGISPRDFPPKLSTTWAPPDFGSAVRSWADDYAGVDVRGKAVLVLRLAAVKTGTSGAVIAPAVDAFIEGAFRRGAAAVLVADPRRKQQAVSRGGNPYRDLAEVEPPQEPARPPAFVVDVSVADRLLAGSGPTASEIYASFAPFPGARDPRLETSLSRPLAAKIRIDLPVEVVEGRSRTLLAATRADLGDRAVVIWAVAPSRLDRSRAAAAALHAAVRSLKRSDATVVLVLFDTFGDVRENALAVRERLNGLRVDLVLGMDALAGPKLRFITPRADLQPVIDHYAAKANVPFELTLESGEANWPTGLVAFIEHPNVLVTGTGGPGDRTADAAALIAYVVARYQARSPELYR